MDRDAAARTLGVSSSSSDDEVRRAYRRLARAHHPDVSGDPARFAAIAEAWESWGATDSSPKAPVIEPERGRDPSPIEDAEPIGDPPRRSVVLLPPTLVGGGVVVAVLGTMSGLLPVVAAGAIAIGVGLAAFVLVPFWVMTRSSRRR
jgi:hypothetical protein